jgi:hypothetical protein
MMVDGYCQPMSKTLDEYPHDVVARVVAALVYDALSAADPAKSLDQDFEWPETMSLVSGELQSIIEDPSANNAKALAAALAELRDTWPNPHEGLHDIQIGTDNRVRAAESSELWDSWQRLALKLGDQLCRSTLVASEARTMAQELTADSGDSWRAVAARDGIPLTGV